MVDRFWENVFTCIGAFMRYTTFCVALVFSVNSQADGAELVDRIVAIVNDDVLTLTDLNRHLQPYAEKIKSLGYSLEKERQMLFKVREDMLNQLIDETLTDQEIKRFNIAVDENEIDNTIERIKETRFITDEELREALASEGLTVEEYRTKLKEQILRNKLVNVKIRSKIVITQDDIRSYYDSHGDVYKGETAYHLRNIIMKVPPLADDSEKIAVREKMEAVLKKLKDGDPFDVTARMYSESSLAAEGGDLGFFKLDALSSELQKIIGGMKPGQLTPVIDTDQGYQIFFVEEITRTPSKSFDEARAEIEEKLFNEIVDKKFRVWLQDLRKGSHIKIIK